MDARQFEAYMKQKEKDASDVYRKELYTGIKCIHCFDCGFGMVDVEGVPLWVYCKCLEGFNKSRGSKFQLPRADYEMLKLFPFKGFPLASFIPKPTENGLIMNVANQIKNRFEKSLRESEKEWNSYVKKENK